MTKHEPLPRLAHWLLRLRLPEDIAEPVLGDLEERCREIAHDDPRAARRFFWRQTIAAFDPRLPRRQDPPTPPLSARAPFHESWLQDLRFGARRLVKSPGFTMTAVATLALGIGANATIFGVVHATLLRPVPFAAPERLVMVWNRTPTDANNRWFLSSADFADLRARSRTLSEVAAVTETVIGPMTGKGTPRHVRISRTTANYFTMLGVEPALGRGFEPADGLPVAVGDEPPSLPVLLSHAAWQRYFGGGRDALGTRMAVFGQPAEVVGVMPADFEMYLPDAADIGHDIDLWWPIRADFSQGPRDAHFLRTVARLAPGAGMAEASAELRAIAAALRREHAHQERLGLELSLAPLADDVVAHVRPTLLVLAGAVGFVMLIACANVAHLLLIRVTARHRELAVRAVLGAGRLRLARQLLSESLALALLGAAGGLLLASLGIEILKRIRPAEMPWIERLAIDPALIAFTISASLLAAMVYGLAPALRPAVGIGASDLQMRSSGHSPAQSRFRSALVIAEVALSLVLLIGAGLMMRTFSELADVPLGFDPEGLLAVDIAMPFALSREERQQVVEEVEDRLAAIPGVAAVGGIFPVPLNGVYVRTCAYSPDGPPSTSERRGEAYFRIVQPSYFAAARLPLVAGRLIDDADLDGDPAVVVIERRLAERLWPGEDPVGRRLFFAVASRDAVEAQVVGVVRDVRQGGLTDERETIYMPRHFYAALEMSFVVRAQEGDPRALFAPIREAIAGHRVEMPVEIRPMDELVDRALVPTRFVLTLMMVFAALAVALAAIGLYGVLAYAVSQRDQEIGVRLAMGATRRDIVRLVLREGTVWALAGTCLGLIMALGLTRFMEHHLYGVGPTDPLAFGATAASLMIVALAASWLPARRAAGVEPGAALRHD